MSNNNSKKGGELQRAVILHPVSSNNNQLKLLKANRIFFYAVISLISVVILLGFFLMSKHSVLSQFEKQQAIAQIQKQQIDPALSKEILALKSQLVGLISGSIEGNLRILEESIQSGTLTTIGKGALQDLKNDVIVLKTYSKTGAGRLIASNTQVTQTKPKLDRQLMDEVSRLKTLFYISIATCGLMVAAIGGIWYQSRYRLSHDRKEIKKN